jgi:hypothetical protein
MSVYGEVGIRFCRFAANWRSGKIVTSHCNGSLNAVMMAGGGNDAPGDLPP